VIVVAFALGGSGGRAAPPPLTPPDSVYRLPAHVAASGPGTIFRRLRLQSPPTYRLTAIVYHSRSASNADILVSGLVAVPTKHRPAHGFPIVSWAHQTTGFTSQSAPSRLGEGATGSFFERMATLGYAVAATDYQGLGVGGPPAYVVGVSAAHTTLDAIRAALRLTDGLDRSRVAVVGHSEGGHAALFAAELANQYAPDLGLRAVVASAPGANLVDGLRSPEATPEEALNVLRLVSAWHLYYGIDVSGLLTPAGIQDGMALMADEPIPQAAQPFKAPPSSNTQLMRLATLNTPGQTPTSVPILILVGTADRQVPPAINLTLAKNLTGIGDQVTLKVLPGADHNETLVEGAPTVASFLSQRLK
jgi:pimeloyl-ACP methyl ester carboxylesterase